MIPKPFRPMLYPSEQVDPKDMKYPLIASYKLDGIRCIFKDGEMLSRSGKLIPNKQLHEKFQYLKDLTGGTSTLVLDGEIYAHELPFQEITSVVMSHDKEVPDPVEFWAFDWVGIFSNPLPYKKRLFELIRGVGNLRFRVPKSQLVLNPEQVEEFMQQALDDGYEGLILNNPSALYKNGRITITSGDGYKLKPYQTFDSKIIGVVQATEVDPDAEKTINELGYSETSKKKDDRVPVEKAAAFEVAWDGEFHQCLGHPPVYTGSTVKVTLAMTDEEKEEVWRNREDYIGRTVEFKGMLHGAKNLPRHPVFVRFRDDKD